ncbi:dynein regulatory complex subunit 4-like isoform X2 [Sphaeramia orbicularis]|uniref:dynein regulatory complex subunit 4-like isoform X2 n=1 Tax=Sphaeramia orbicularis TaxID=375764 RepID=UPI0011801008|nr:dynein regulatory complex subunit 4-like isoform X2 [Sphaeramia orbicularis]
MLCPRRRCPKTSFLVFSGQIEMMLMFDLQLEEHIIRLREELDREREERSYFQLERDKVQAFWEIAKRNLEETKAELRHTSREREEAEERHRVEINVYKQKLKHVLSEQHNAITAQKTDGVLSTSLVQKQNADSELHLLKQKHGLQADLKDKEFANEEGTKRLQEKHQLELVKLMNKYDAKIREIEFRHNKMMLLMVQEEEKKKEAHIAEIQERMTNRIETLKQDHERTLRGAEEQYSRIERETERDHRLLMDEVSQLKVQLARMDRKLTDAQQENKRLTESLQDAEQKLPELQKNLDDYKQSKAEDAASRARVKKMEQEMRHLTVEHNILLTAFEKVELERDQLKRSQMQAIVDVQQKNSLKEMLLQRKMKTLTEHLETKEAQLCAAIASSNVEPAAANSAANRLEEILDSKNTRVMTLQDELIQDMKAYDEQLQTCTTRLKALGVPSYDIPFRPADQILNRPKP